MQEAYPGTLWARRAGFRIGWALLKGEPDRAIDYLRGARKDFPVLEDYVLLKLGQALGRMGSFHESAMAFEAALGSSVPSALRNETSYEAGFAWFENGQCQPAVAHLEQAAAREPDSPSAPRALVPSCRLRRSVAASELGATRAGRALAKASRVSRSPSRGARRAVRSAGRAVLEPFFGRLL